MTTYTAAQHLQALLGTDAIDDHTWHDLDRFAQAAYPIVRSNWNLDTELDAHPWRLIHPSTDAERSLAEARLAQACVALQHELGSRLSPCAATFFLHPQLWKPAYLPRAARSQYYVWNVYETLLRQVAETSVLQHLPPDWTVRICRRIVTLCTALPTQDEPNFARCIELLLDAQESLGSPLLDALSAGAWETAASVLTEVADMAPSVGVADALKHYWETCHIHTERLLRRLAQTGQLSIASFRRLLECIPHGLHWMNHRQAQQLQAAQRDTAEYAWSIQLRDLLDTVLWELVSDLRPETWPSVSQIHFLSGGRYLLRIAEEIDRQELSTLPRAGRSDRLDGLLVSLLQILHRRDDDDPAALTSLLRHIRPAVLLAMLPYTPAYEGELCGALGWPGAPALLRLLRRIEAHQPGRSDDPRVGVLAPSEVLQITQDLDEAHLRQLLDTCAASLPDSVLLVRAVLGWNAKDLRRMLGRRNRMAVRALPLLPITQPDEVLKRYLLLARYQREANSSSTGRKIYERAAAEAGFANLALAAGYADTTRLEWAMQAQLGAEQTAIGRNWTIEGYTITLTLGDRGPTLSIRNPKRVLKRFPSIVTRDYAYREVRATLEQAQHQDRRIRQALLNAMRSASPLTTEELALLRANPVAARQLARLILIDEAGAHGVFCPEDGTLEGTRGERLPITGAVVIAHPGTLAERGVLTDWQAEIVRRQIVQPFKQAFRELYVLTPAERAAGTSSARLAGRRMHGRQALAVLANMGWSLDGYLVRKPFYALGFAAQFETGVYDLDDEGSARTGSLTFWPLEHRRRDDTGIPLTDVPPLVFSEVVRDLDLVTVIAHQSEDGGTSREVLQRRAELVQATTQALGFRQVEVEGSFATVTGQLSSYRIQLATGAVYLASGQYVCIVPKPKAQQAIYLPFAEGGDPVTTEVVSKVLLLANDQAIRDETILAQIVPQQRAA